MSSIDEQINSLLVQQQDFVEKILRIVLVLNLIFAIGLLLYRYGFYLKQEEIDFAFRQLNVVFVVFSLSFLVRLLFHAHRWEFLRKGYFEAFLYLVLLVHGVAYYSFGYKISVGVFEYFGSGNPELLHQHIVSIYALFLVGLEIIKVSSRIAELELNPATTFIISFILLIAVGTGLLMLPGMTVGKDSMRFIDALFTSTSASCVTGLAVEDTGRFFTLKGQLVVMFLFQLGGIGIVSFATFFATFLSKGVGLKQQSIIQDYLSSENLLSTKGLLRKVIFLTILIEFISFVFIYFSWDPELKFNSVGQKIFFSAFHAVSAFCNAGFSLFSDGLYYNELSDGVQFERDGMDVNVRVMYQLHFIVALTIVFGSLGFNTIEDVFSPSRIKERLLHPWKEFKVSTRIALYSTGVLTLIGMAAVMFLEFETLRYRTIVEALNTAFFQSVTTRTAGFNTMDFGAMREPTIIVMIFLMFIGACPGSTGGGIKTSTFYLIVLSSIANIKNQERVVFSRRTIPNSLIQKAFSIFMFATTYNIVAIFILSISESGNENINIVQLTFELVSAFSTAGLSMGITSELNDFSRVVMIISMYIGRVGTLTLALALSDKVKTNAYRYPEGHIMVG